MSIIVDFVTVGPFQENSFIVWQEESRSAFLIDPGDEPEKIIRKINELNVDPQLILNTHAHLDHVGGVKKIKDTFSIPFYIHCEEKRILEHYPDMCRMFGMIPGETPEVDYWISGEGEFDFEGMKLEYIETPGHTPGGTTFVLDGHCFCGDTLFAGSIGRTDLPGGNYNTLMDSILKLKNKLDPECVIHPGHGETTTMKHELIHNPFLTSIINQN